MYLCATRGMLKIGGWLDLGSKRYLGLVGLVWFGLVRLCLVRDNVSQF